MKIKNKWINGLIIFTLTLLVAVPSIGYPVGTFWNNPIVRGVLDASGATTKLGTVVMSGSIANTIGTAITAGTTQTQAGATLLTKDINDVTTVGSAGDGVRLPSAIAGTSITVKNSGANILAVYPFLADSINALAVNLPIRIQPGSVVNFFAKNTIVWESNYDTSLTINAPTTNKGQLELKAADSAGNTLTQIINASQAGARTYTIPDAGASAYFVMSAGASSLAGVRTFTDITDSTTKDTGSIITEGGIGAEKAIFSGTSITATTNLVGEKTLLKTALGTTPVGTVAIVEYGDGRNITTELTLTNFIIGALPGAAADLGIGNIIYTFPAGQHFELVSSFSNISLTAAGTPVNTETGLGSVIASGVISALNGNATFEDRITGQVVATDPGGGAAANALTAATAGIGTGISLNLAASVKNVFLNSAGTWNADNTGNLTASGKIYLHWVKM
jgi:hypothetical protein